MKELKETMTEKPGAIVLAVGGGGLLCGVVQGLAEVGWREVGTHVTKAGNLKKAFMARKT